MNICVFGAARDELSPAFFALGEALGEAMGRRGHAMVFGGGARGLMGAAARGLQRTGGAIVSVIPRFFDGEALWEDNAECIRTDTLAQRKAVMLERSDAFLVLPGGLGTFDEFFEVLTMRNLGLHDKPIALLECEDYWEGAAAMVRAAVEKGFAAPRALELFRVFTEAEACLDWLEREART